MGRHVAAHLAGRGVETVGVDVTAPRAAPPAGAQWLTADIRKPETLTAALAGADAVIHLASAHLQVGVPEDLYWSVNVRALHPLLAAARAAGVRHFVHTSSVGVHGSLTTIPGDEDAAIAPENLYERTKAKGEEAVRDFMAAAPPPPMGITIVRPAWVYGVGDARTERILRAVAQGRFVVFGPGSNYRHPISITDYLNGLDALLLEPRAFGRTYILAGPEYLTSREFLAAVERVTGGRIRLRVPLGAGYAAGLAAEALGALLRRAPPISRRTLAFFTNQNAFDTARARAEIGFRPVVSVEEGLRAVWTAMQRVRGGAA